MMIFSVTGHIRAGYDTVRSAKIRSFWTMLGIIIGISAVITIVAIGEGIKQQIGGQIHHYGSNIIDIRTSQLQAGSGSSAKNITALSGLNVSSSLNDNDIKTVNSVTGVSSTSPLTLVSGTTKGDNGNYNAGYVIGTTSALPSLINQSLAYGSFISDEDTGQYNAVIGSHVAQKMFNEDVPLGRSFKFRGHEFIVKGIFNDFTFTPLSQQANFNNAIFIPNDIAETISNNSAPTYEILAKAKNIKQTNAVAVNIKTALDNAHGGQSGLSVLSGNQDINNSNNILDLLTKLIAGVAAISLIVAGIGIMNVMLVSVSERVREIGIRKAVGATNRQILGQFMIESTIISSVGGLSGIILAYFIDLAIRLSTDFKPIISWQIVVIATGVSIMVGVVFGSAPALKAARKDPIEALRAE